MHSLLTTVSKQLICDVTILGDDFVLADPIQFKTDS